MILTATIICDRKSYHQLTAIPTLAKIPDSQLYIVIDTKLADDDFKALYAPLYDYLEVNNINAMIDVVNLTSNWRPEPQYDQDQVRLAPIVMCRNMAIDAAMTSGASHLLFVDSDVVINPEDIATLKSHNVNIVSGLVPGRGIYSHVFYVFGEKSTKNGLTNVDHATCGYMLIKRDVFKQIRFRWTEKLSEDPALGIDLQKQFKDCWKVDKNIHAQHIDNPHDPLTAEGACR